MHVLDRNARRRGADRIATRPNCPQDVREYRDRRVVVDRRPLGREVHGCGLHTGDRPNALSQSLGGQCAQVIPPMRKVSDASLPSVGPPPDWRGIGAAGCMFMELLLETPPGLVWHDLTRPTGSR